MSFNLNQLKSKSFWQRPEGVTGLLFLGGIIVGGAILLYKILPFIISLLQNAIHAALLFAALGAILYILLDPRFRNLLWYFYKSAMRWITSLFVQINPISILETYVEYLYKNIRLMDHHIGKLKGQMAKLKSIIDQNIQEMKQSMDIAEQAKKKGNMELVAVHTRQYGRLEDANKRFNELYGRMEVLYKVLSKIHKNSGYLVKDIENEVRMRKQERAAIRSSYSAMRSAMNIIHGDPDKKAIFDQAMEAVIDDVSTKIGEMERFIELSANFIESVDLQNGVYEQRGLELLEKIDKEGTSLFISGDNYKLPEHVEQVLSQEVISGIPEAEKIHQSKSDSQDSNYKHLF